MNSMNSIMMGEANSGSDTPIKSEHAQNKLIFKFPSYCRCVSKQYIIVLKKFDANCISQGKYSSS